MAFIEFPKWKYHADYEPVIVSDVEQEKKLGSEWKDNPALCGKPDSAPAADPLKPKLKAKK